MPYHPQLKTSILKAVEAKGTFADLEELALFIGSLGAAAAVVADSFESENKFAQAIVAQEASDVLASLGFALTRVTMGPFPTPEGEAELLEQATKSRMSGGFE